MAEIGELPRWDLSNIYSSLEGEDYRQAMAEYERALGALEEQFDGDAIRRDTPLDHPRSTPATLAQVLGELNALLRLSGTLDAFVYGYLTTNSYDTVATRARSKVELLSVRQQQLMVRLRGWIGGRQEQLEAWFDQSDLLAAHAYFLRDAVRTSRFQMTDELEALAAELCVDGGVAFGKLQGTITSQLKVPWQQDGAAQQDGPMQLVPIPVIRNLSYAADRATRERANRVEQAGWESVRSAVAACLNGVKGTAATLARRRGRESVLAAALDDNRIDADTLSAMMGAIDAATPVFHRYFGAKARRLGLPRLAWWDLFAPLGGDERTFTWDAARTFVVEKFSTFCDDLGEFAATAFERRWIDAEPRDGKRGGAYCMEVVGVDESRILANFDGSFEQVGTLAHELGHGYHNHCQRGLEPLRRGAPSTLAETASIFCETLVAEACLDEANEAAAAQILELQLCGAAQVCLDIRSRFLFESEVFARRASSELSADEFCELMRAAQAQTYGEAIDPQTYHPYMWLWKPHYYEHTHNFYNFPYAFGHLFGLGLFAIYREQGAAFVPRYQQLLRSTGESDAAPLAQRFGIDLRSREFWAQSLAVIEQQVARYEQGL